MDPQTQSSFIPKKPLTGTGGRTNSFAFVGLFFLLAVLVFIASLVSAGAVFAYEGYLSGSIASKSDSLNKAQAAFDPGAIQELVRMDSRLTNANALLEKHIAPSALFAFLSTQTLERVSFSSFSYALGDDGSVTIALAGEADSFSTLALQSDQFNTNKLFKDAIFSGISVGGTGQVAFNVQAKVDPSLINYTNSLTNTPPTPTPTPTPAPVPAISPAPAPMLP